jgi:hypothetical protein
LRSSAAIIDSMVGQGLLGQGADGVLDGFLGRIGTGLELLLQQRFEIADLERLAFLGLGFGFRFGHDALLLCLGFGGAIVGGALASEASACSRAGSCRTLFINSSAPVLPSI